MPMLWSLSNNSGDLLLQQPTTSAETYDAGSADDTPIGFPRQSAYQISCPPSLSQGENDGEDIQFRPMDLNLSKSEQTCYPQSPFLPLKADIEGETPMAPEQI
jgi:hypothetical protein